MNKIFLSILVPGLLLLSSCAPRESAPSPTPIPSETSAPTLATSADDIVGVWQLGSGPRTLYFEFNQDETYRMALGVVTNLDDSPQHQGQYKFEDGLLTFMTSDDSVACPGQNGTYEVHLLEEGRLALSLVEDECTLRGGTNLSPLEPYTP